MRTFEIYVKGKKAACDTPIMHVPPYIHEDFAVYLKPGLEKKYKLDDLVIKNNKGNWLTQQRINDATIMLHDHNQSPGRPKFCVSLTPRGTANPKVAKLDPIFVNE